MHLSFLSDSFLSDSLADADPLCAERSLGRAHRDGLLRGLLFVAALALPFGLMAALAPSQAAKVAPSDTTHLRVVHSHLS